MVESSGSSVSALDMLLYEADLRLPNAPSMKIYCLYGHGKETERSYWYMQGEYEQDDTRSDGVDDTAFVSPELVQADPSAT